MMWCTVAFCVFPSGTSHQRCLKRPNGQSQRVNPPLFSRCLQPSRCFPFDPHKRPLFLFPGLSIPQRSQVTLVSGWSCHCKSKHLTAIRAWWKRSPRKKAAQTPHDYFKQRPTFHMLMQLRAHTNTLRLNYSGCWGCLGERAALTLDTWTRRAGWSYLLWDGPL